MNEYESFIENLKSEVDAAHTTIDGGNIPPPSLWRTVRARAKPTTTPEENHMIASLSPASVPISTTGPVIEQHRGVRHSLNLVASFLVVLSVAVGGWFATMQLNQPGSSNNRFALLGQTGGDATCDVEPMTLDEAMAIIENPYAGIETGEASPTQQMHVRNMSLFQYVDQPQYLVDGELLESFQQRPENDSFAAASERMDAFLACVQDGTIGHLFRFLTPFEVQRIVFSNYPVYRDEATIRAELEEILLMPGSQFVTPFGDIFADPTLTFAANPDIDMAAASSQVPAIRYGASEIILIGLRVADENGEIVFQNDHRGYANPVGPLSTTDRFRIVMAKSLFDGEWYVLAVLPE